MILPSPRGWISAKQSPPMPVDCGSITPRMAKPATAASTAVPPSRSTSIAASDACGCEVATIALVAWTVDLPGKWKFLIEFFALIGRMARMARRLGKPGLHDTFRPAGAMLACQGNGCHPLGIELLVAGFPGWLRLLNGRHDLQGRRLLPIRRPARLPRAAGAVARVLRRPGAEGQRAARAGGHQRHGRGPGRGDRRPRPRARARRLVRRQVEQSRTEVLDRRDDAVW